MKIKKRYLKKLIASYLLEVSTGLQNVTLADLGACRVGSGGLFDKRGIKQALESPLSPVPGFLCDLGGGSKPEDPAKKKKRKAIYPDNKWPMAITNQVNAKAKADLDKLYSGTADSTTGNKVSCWLQLESEYAKGKATITGAYNAIKGATTENTIKTNLIIIFGQKYNELGRTHKDVKKGSNTFEEFKEASISAFRTAVLGALDHAIAQAIGDESANNKAKSELNEELN